MAAERATFRFLAPHHAVAGFDSSMFTHYEPAYARVRVDGVRGGRLGLLPFLVDVGGADDAEGGAKVAVTESAREDYPGTYLVRDTPRGVAAGLAGVFPAAALEERRQTDRDIVVARRAPYLARTAGRRYRHYIDFVQRDDQAAVNFLWRLAREAAARRLVLDLHGAHKPPGFERAYPNAATRRWRGCAAATGTWAP